MTVRGASLFVSGCLVLIALVLAVAPFSLAARPNITGLECRSPVVSAWSRGPKDQLQLWAVTVGTEMRGYEVVSGTLGPWCRGPARSRLLVSGGLLIAAVIVGTVGPQLLRRLAPSALGT